MTLETNQALDTLTGRGDPATVAARRHAAAHAARNEEFAAIREKGFGAFVKELEEKKIEEMRREILAKMGLNEEKLAEMSPEQRGKIEKLIADEIRRRLTANSEMKAAENSENQPPSSLISTNGGGPGLAILQALQERDDFDRSSGG